MNTICDLCPAPAKITVGHDLLGQPGRPALLAFCRHHFNANADALLACGWMVLDHTEPYAAHMPAPVVAGHITHRKVRRP